MVCRYPLPMFRLRLVLCLLGVSLCVNGFLIGYSKRRMRRPTPIRGQNPSDDIVPHTSIRQTSSDDAATPTIYPTDTLLNIGVNTTQTLAPDIAYFYLQNTLGLSEETMWKITLESGSTLGMTPRNLEKKVSLLRRTMNLSDEDVRVILGKQPALLHYSAERNLAPTILFLVRALDLSKSELRSMVMECPSILGYNLDNLKKKIAFFVALYTDHEDGVGCIRKILVGEPKLLLCAVDTGLIPRMKFLKDEIGFQLEELQLLYRKNPKLLMYSLDDNLREKIIFFFILQLLLDPEEVQKVLLSFPQVMDYNLENHMKPIAEYFINDLEFSAAEFGSIILKFPRVFSYSEFKLKHVIGILRFELGLNSQQVKRVVFQAPQVFGLSDHTLSEKLDLLRDRLELNQRELGLVLSKMPTILCLGVNNSLVPKLDYLEESLVDQYHPTNQLLKRIILKQPTLLGYSLDRIKARMEQISSANISPDKITVGISMSEDKFGQWLDSSRSKRIINSIVTRRNSTSSGVLYQMLNFSEDELNELCCEVPEINDWAVPSLQTWIKHLDDKLGMSGNELKSTILTHPQLLDASSRSMLKHRLKGLHAANLTISDHIDTMYLSDDEFDDWIGQKQKEGSSKIAYLRRELCLDDAESCTLLSKVPDLEMKATKVYQQKVDYYIAQFSNSTEKAKQVLLEQPSLLELSVKRVVEPRMEMIRRAGVSDSRLILAMITMADNMFETSITLAALRNQCSDTVAFLRSALDLNETETDSLLLALANNLTHSNIEETIKFLVDLADDSERVKPEVLKQPHLLLLSPEMLERRIDERKSQPRATEDLFAIATMTDEEYQTCALLAVLQNKLNFTENELNVILACSHNDLGLESTLVARIDYLLSRGSIDDVKNAILSRPMLSHPLEELQSMPNVLAMKRGKSSPPHFANESRAVLRDVLGLGEEEANSILSPSRSLSLRDPEAFLVPKLDYLLEAFDESNSQQIRSCVLANPRLLDFSLEDMIIPRMKLLIDSGLDPSHINDIISLGHDELDERAELQTHLNLTDSELEHILPMKDWLSQRCLRQSSKAAIQYLASQVNDSKDSLKQILLDEPRLLALSLSRTIQPRMNMLLASGCSPTDIGKVALLTPKKAEEYCSKRYLRKTLGLSAKQANHLFASAGRSALIPPTSLKEKVDYLVPHVFEGSGLKLKEAVVQKPKLLKQSLVQTIRPRAELLQYLKSIGLEYPLSDIADLFTLSDPSFTKKMIPQIQTWYPSTSNEIDEAYEETGDGGNSIASAEMRIQSMLRDFPTKNLALAYSDELNREGARVVHWRG